MIRLLTLYASFAIATTAALAEAASKPNILFIAVDDLRPWLGCYEKGLEVSPQIDRLAASGRIFDQHYVQVPTCGASRCALLFGRRPGHFPGDTGNDAIKATAANQPLPSLPALLRENGYRTVAIGKISHYPGGHSGKGWIAGKEELPGAWDVCSIPTGPWPTPEAAMHGYAGGKAREKGTPVSESAPGDDKTYPDGWIAEEALAQLNRSTTEGKPFFLAVGFIKPHLPFAAPASYFEKTQSQEIAAPKADSKPSFPSTWHNSGEFRKYQQNLGDVFQSPAAALKVRRAYLSCIRYTDTQVGKLLAALEASPAGKNTIVVLWGDHGWLLGEHGIWGKHCLFEEALRSPLIIRTPNQKQPGARSNAIVETVDIYPTLTALAGIKAPEGAEGESLETLLADPAAKSDGLAGAAFGGSLTIRDERFRLIVSRKNPKQVELYDHHNDPSEQTNLAEKQPETVAALRAKLDAMLTPQAK